MYRFIDVPMYFDVPIYSHVGSTVEKRVDEENYLPENNPKMRK